IVFQLFDSIKGLLDGFEVRQIGGRLEYLGVADYPLFVHDKCGAFGYAVHVENEIIIKTAIGGGGGLIEIAQEGKIEVLVLFILREREQGVDTDPEHLGVGVVVGGDIIAGAAQFFGAGSGEGLRKEEQQDVLSFEVAERYFLFVRVVQ